jgi:hypothetical protein
MAFENEKTGAAWMANARQRALLGAVCHAIVFVLSLGLIIGISLLTIERHADAEIAAQARTMVR